MANPPDESTILSAALPFVRAGAAVHWLHRREKRPVGNDWQTAPVHTFESLKASYQRGYNIGIRPGEHSKTAAGYLHLFDLDIRDPAQADDAWAALLKLWPEAKSAPFVISGSGGESRHIYFFSDRPFRSKTFAHSKGFAMVFDAKKGREVKKNDWEVALFGAPKQAVLPPSIHPDTGEPYVWGREIDWDLVEMGAGPFVSAAKIESWGANADDLNDGDDDDLFAIVRTQPMGLTEAEIERTLADLPEEWVDDRDQWLQVGAALHHEHEGGALGFERWCEWSRQSPKFDIQDQKRVWKSFKGKTHRPVRMATLIQAAGRARLARDHGVDDLLGPSPSTELAVIEDIADLLGPTALSDLDDLLGTPDPITPGVRVVDDFDPEWRSYLQYGEDAKALKPSLHNVELIIRYDARFRGVIGFNEFTQEVVQIGTPGNFKLKKAGPKPVRQLDSSIWRLEDPVNGDLWTESQDHDIRLVIATPTRQGGYNLSITDRDLKAAIDKAAHRNKFHPIRAYLDSLKWDGVSRVNHLFTDYLGAPDDAYHREAALLFMIGAVTRVFEPGHKFDFVPILEGLQGKRKSTFINIVARHWFAELEGDFHDTKAMVEKMQGSWILEIPELQGFSRAEVTTIKGFVSRTSDKCRLAYDKRARVFKRQCVYMGSTNEEEYLRDSTGGRRFWPVKCTVAEIDTDRLSANIDQLWAEARMLFQAWRQRHPQGTLPLYMKNDAAATAKLLQESRRQQSMDDVLAARIEAWLDAPIGSELGFDDVEGEEPVYRNEVCLMEIWEQMMGQDINKQSDRDQQLLGRAMRKVPGWHFAGTRRFKHYGKLRAFARDEPR